jgi:hypothetical protein
MWEKGEVLMARDRDPIPRKGGRPLSPFLPIAVAAVIVIMAAPALYLSSGDGYDNVERLASVKCLGCLGLNQVVPGFSGFWTDYPQGHAKAGEAVPHPAMVRDVVVGTGGILVLFFWTQGCVPCAAQWENMLEEGIVSGEEDGGREGSAYPEMTLFSLDASITDPVDLDMNGTVYSLAPQDLFWTYHISGKRTDNGVPVTTFMFESAGEINWWSFYGKEMKVDEFRNMMEQIRYHQIAHSA